MRTLVAVPCMDFVHAVFMRSLLRMERVGELDFEIVSGSLIYDARNALAREAIEGKYDRVLWLDSDMVFEKDLLQRLSRRLDEGKEMVTGLYFKRKEPFGPCIYRDCGLYAFQPGELTPTAIPYLNYPENDVFEIEACGFGAVLMSVEAIKRTTDRLGQMPFMPIRGFGEDLSFCLRFCEAGGKIWCDSGVRAGHAGIRIYDAEDYLRGCRQ